MICTDKTGTLTLNQMTARQIFTCGEIMPVSGEGYAGKGEIISSTGKLPDMDALLLPITLCNDAQISKGKVHGDPMEGALLSLAVKGGVDIDQLRQDYPRISEIPFDADHKYHATFHRVDERIRIMIKGAPDILVNMCEKVRCLDGESQLTDEQSGFIEEANEKMAATGLRILAIAWAEMPASEFDADGDLFRYVKNLVFTGLVGLMDPPRPEAREAIKLCHRAGKIGRAHV